jgi:hypothetical protein
MGLHEQIDHRVRGQLDALQAELTTKFDELRADLTSRFDDAMAKLRAELEEHAPKTASKTTATTRSGSGKA